MSEGYEILALDEAERVAHRDSTLIPVRYLLGFRPAGVNAWYADTGDQLMPPHTEDSGNEELYVVVQGRATFTVGEETKDAAAGTLVFVPAEVFRSAVAAEDGTIVFVVGGTVGQAFNAGGWEEFTLAEAYRHAGRIDDGRAVMERMVAEKPDYWAAAYNAGCWESMAGNPDAAFAHLRRAKELNAEEAAPYFREDTDLDNIRDDPRFQELLR
jgi:mannose-6-phosphate isomerase-like protein (cupin superfamily)